MNGNLQDYAGTAFDVVIVAGQSNAEGCGLGVKKPYVPNDKVLFLQSGYSASVVKENGAERLDVSYTKPPRIEVAAMRTVNAEQIGELSLRFAERYVEGGVLSSGRKLLIIRAAVGGTGFAKKHWGPSDILFKKMLDLTDAALALNPQNRLAALLWHQGEHDAFENPDMPAGKRRYSYYYNLKCLVRMVRDRYGRQSLPFITGSFCGEWERKNRAVCEPVLEAARVVCRELGHAYFADASDLKSNNEAVGNGDDIHFCADSLSVLGDRYFDAFQRIAFG